MEHYEAIVIGGGIAGAAAAYELAADSTVLIVEREPTCGHHSTGRSAALFTECYGDSVVRRLARAGRDFMTTPPSGFHGPILTPRATLFVADSEQTDLVEGELRDFSQMVPDVTLVDAAQARRMCPALREEAIVAGIVEPTSMDIDVHALHSGFLAGASSRGARLRTSSPVESLDRNDRGRWEVGLEGGDRVLGDVVVDAAGAWCDEVAAIASVAPLGLQPMRRTVFTFDPGRPHESWPMVVDIAERFYFKPEGPHILASPADETPVDPHDVRPDEIDVAIGIERINEVTTLDVRHVKSTWAGLRSFLGDRRPVAGFDADAPGFFWLAGQGGYGIKTAAALGRVTAALVRGDRLPEDIEALGLTAADLAPARIRRQRAEST